MKRTLKPTELITHAPTNLNTMAFHSSKDFKTFQKKIDWLREHNGVLISQLFSLLTMGGNQLMNNQAAIHPKIN